MSILEREGGMGTEAVEGDEVRGGAVIVHEDEEDGGREGMVWRG